MLPSCYAGRPSRVQPRVCVSACECGQLNIMNEQGDPLARTGEVSTRTKTCARMSAAHSLILAATRIHTPTTASRGCFFTRVGSRVRTGGDGTERRDAAVTWCIGAASSGVKFQWPRINPQRNHTTGTQQQSRGVRGLRFGGSPGAPRAVARCTSSGQRALVTGLF